LAKDKAPIVIKKITINAAGAHGGAWKVAFADFMTAMMTFFLVMWLVNQPEDVKKQVASYFSGPSVLEQNLSAFGAELTLEKLFLDLMNDPLKAAQSILQPSDMSPDLMSLGSKKMALQMVANELGELAQDVSIKPNSIEFDIPDIYLSEVGTSNPTGQFVEVAKKMRGLIGGSQDSEVVINSTIVLESMTKPDAPTAKSIAEARLDLVKNQIESAIQHDTVKVIGKATVAKSKSGKGNHIGYIRVTIRQKEFLSDGRKPRPLRDLFDSKKSSDMSVYDDFVKKISKEKTKRK
jgi:chemotaxis protein MotB